MLGTDPDDTGTEVTIQAHVPSSEIQRYAIDLRSMTAGTGGFEVSHRDYQPVPESELDRVVAEASASKG